MLKRLQGNCPRRSALGKGEENDWQITKMSEFAIKFLGWHVCRTKLARNLFSRHEIFSRKMLWNFPRNCWAFLLWVRKNPTKFPPNFPPDFSPKNQNITDELLQERRENKFCNFSVIYPYPGPSKGKDNSQHQVRGFLGRCKPGRLGQKSNQLVWPKVLWRGRKRPSRA